MHAGWPNQCREFIWELIPGRKKRKLESKSGTENNSGGTDKVTAVAGGLGGLAITGTPEKSERGHPKASTFTAWLLPCPLSEGRSQGSKAATPGLWSLGAKRASLPWEQALRHQAESTAG